MNLSQIKKADNYLTLCCLFDFVNSIAGLIQSVRNRGDYIFLFQYFGQDQFVYKFINLRSHVYKRPLTTEIILIWNLFTNARLRDQCELMDPSE